MIRRAEAADLAAIVALERESATAPHWAPAEYARALTGSEPLRACFVAYERDGLAGFAVGVLGMEEAELESVVVRESLRGQGWGRALCGAVIEWARELGARAVMLEVRAGSAGALHLYRSLGFVPVGRRPNYYSEPVEDGIVMHYLLKA